MTVFLVKKEKGRQYKSEDVVRALWGFELIHDEDRAPHLAGPGSEGLFISISDTVNYWACCIEPHRAGLDMEELSRKVKPSTARRLHKDEQEYLAALSEGGSEWTEEFFSVWTRKEAWSKYKGVGLSIDFSSFSVMDGSIEGVPITSFKYRGLMFGIAGDTEASVQRVSYEAPFKKSALDYAASLLDIRGYTSAELSKKLLDRGYCEEDVRQALEKLKDYGYVNDEAFAQSFARRGAEAGKSAFRIETELRQKGLSREEAREAAAELKENDEERARAEAEKLLRKLGEQSDREKAYGKVSRKLASLGYTPSVIYSVMEDLFR